VSYVKCLQSVKEKDSEKLSTGSVGTRQSIKESDFSNTYADLLKPLYKHYQAMQFAALGHRFPWNAASRKACVRALLDAAREVHPRETYTHFKKAVEAELLGHDGALRYKLPLHIDTS
jgi:hypothetical protein